MPDEIEAEPTNARMRRTDVTAIGARWMGKKNKEEAPEMT